MSVGNDQSFPSSIKSALLELATVDRRLALHGHRSLFPFEERAEIMTLPRVWAMLELSSKDTSLERSLA